MARFGKFERFEVKNEMRDIKEISPDDNKQTGGASSTQSQEDIKKEANRVGFDEEIDFADIDDLIEDYKSKNSQVESELEQYYDEDITPEELKAYLVSKITEIYGEKLTQCNVLIDNFVEGFLMHYDFRGAESYRQLAKITEETIKNITGTMKKSKIVDNNQLESQKQAREISLSAEETRRLLSTYQMMSNQSELIANAYISTQAKKLGVDKKHLTSYILAKAKESISSPNKVLHYHRTSMQAFEQIIQTGYLLSRKNMQLNGIDISRLSGSSSSNIQFSRDIYDSNGVLQAQGFNQERNLGANSTDVVFVMGPELMQEDSYNCLSPYPTVEKADIQRCCVAILAKDPIIQMQVEKILKAKNISIRTMLQEDFDRNIVLEQLTRPNTSKQVEETGAILKSVNGRDILATGINRANKKPNHRNQPISPSPASIIYKEYIKYRACLKDKTQFLTFSEYIKQLHNIEKKSDVIVDEELKNEIRGMSR